MTRHILSIPAHVRPFDFGYKSTIAIERNRQLGGYSVYFGSAFPRVFQNAREAVSHARAEITRLKAKAGKHTAANAWNGIAMANQAAARLRRTAADLLRDEKTREAVFTAATEGKSYTADLDILAPRAEVKAAITFAADRLATRAAFAAEPTRPGRILDMQAERQTFAALDRWHKHTAKIIGAVQSAYDACDFRTATAGDHTLSIFIAPEAGASSMTTKGETYSSRCTYRKTDSTHFIRVKQDWKRTVERNGFATIDDCLVVDAKRIKTGVWEVKYVRQGRGFALEVESGVIVRHGGVTRLARDEKAARTLCVKEFAEAIC